MPKLLFREVDRENFYEIVKLHNTLTETQKICVASNAYSIAEGSVHPNNAYYRGIFLDDTPIGFFMLFIPSEESIKIGETDFFLWRFMIAKDYQGKGYGFKSLDMISELALSMGYKVIKTSCEMIEGGPYLFYKKYGFKKDGKTYDEEIGLEYIIKKVGEN